MCVFIYFILLKSTLKRWYVTSKLPDLAAGVERFNIENRQMEISDMDLAAQLGVDSNSARTARRKRGIPSSTGRDGRGRTDWDKEPLGEMPDQDLALMIGLTPSAVSKARTARDIPPYYKHGGITWTDE